MAGRRPGGQVFRVEVDDEYGTVALVLDAPSGAPVGELAARLVRDVAALPGVTSADHARQILLALLTRQYADGLASDRVAQQRRGRRKPPRQEPGPPQGSLF